MIGNVIIYTFTFWYYVVDEQNNLMKSIQVVQSGSGKRTGMKKKSGPRRPRKCRQCGQPMLGHKKKGMSSNSTELDSISTVHTE